MQLLHRLENERIYEGFRVSENNYFLGHDGVSFQTVEYNCNFDILKSAYLVSLL